MPEVTDTGEEQREREEERIAAGQSRQEQRGREPDTRAEERNHERQSVGTAGAAQPGNECRLLEDHQ